eukprot:SAG31_NODE_526_length_14475_cov_5.135197_15_plen_62_part_00
MRSVHTRTLNACMDRPDVDTAMKKYLDIHERVYQKLGLGELMGAFGTGTLSFSDTETDEDL